MTKTNLIKNTRRINLYRLILPTIFLIILLIIEIRTSVFNCIFPTAMTSSDSGDTMYDDGIKYVNLTCQKLYYTGYDYMLGSKVKGHYYYSLENQKCTIYIFSTKYFTSGEVPEILENVNFNALLVNNSENRESLLTLLARDMSWTLEGISEYSDEIIISEMDYSLMPVIFISSFTFIAFAYTLCHILILIHNIIAPRTAYTFFNLGKWRLRKQLIAAAVDEFNSKTNFDNEEMYLTDNFFIYSGNYNVAIIPIDSIAWIYKYSRLHNYLLWSKMTYSVKIITKSKRYFNFHGKSKEAADQLLDYFSEHYPNILIGYSDENRLRSKNMFKSILSNFLKIRN